MDFLQRYKKLCTPAAIYFTISALSLIIIGLQNISNPGRLCLGTYDCPAPGSNNIIVFIVQAIYILLVTYILNLICKDNNERLSWFLVLFPIILMFIFYGITMMQMNSTKEGLEGLEDGLVEEYDSEGEGDDSGPVGDEDDDDEILTAKFDDLTVEGFEGMSSPDNSEAQNQLNEMANELKELQADVLGFESFESSKTEEPGIGHHEGLILEGNEDKDKRIKELEQENQQLQVDVDTAEQETIVAEGETAAAEQETAAAEAETLKTEAELETAETETEAAEAAEKIANDEMTSAIAESVSGFEPMGADANIFG